VAAVPEPGGEDWPAAVGETPSSCMFLFIFIFIELTCGPCVRHYFLFFLDI
jgi:hypothetical protein